MNRLKGQRVYLAGPIDRVKDQGKVWREYVTPFLENMGIEVFNPVNKPSDVGVENNATHVMKKKLKDNEKYDELSEMMKIIRTVDLRLVDLSDFLIVSLDLNVHMCGTLEELFLANRQKKPILVWVRQGKKHAPDWLFGTIPHEMIFNSWKEIQEYLEYINTEESLENCLSRWCFFNLA